MLGGLAWAEVTQLSIPVPAAPIAKGTVLTPELLTTRSLSSSQVFVSTVQSLPQAVGLQAVRPLASGQPISVLHLRVPPVVSRSSTVSFIFARGAVKLSGTGQALEDGMAGQSIRLLNPATRATLVGVVQPNGQVLVN